MYWESNKCLESKVNVMLLSVQLFATPWTVAYQAPPPMGFSRPECWSGLPFPSPGDLLTQESNLGLLHCRQVLYCLSHQGSPISTLYWARLKHNNLSWDLACYWNKKEYFQQNFMLFVPQIIKNYCGNAAMNDKILTLYGKNIIFTKKFYFGFSILFGF